MQRKSTRKHKQKATRKIRVTVRRFERYGIPRHSSAIVVMNGDVRTGELGYFAVDYNDPLKPYRYNLFAIVCEQDSTCFDKSSNGARTPEGFCLRADNIKKCSGHHNAVVYGRVCAVEQGRKPVDATLKFRPYDEREALGELTSLNLKDSIQRVTISGKWQNADHIKDGETVTVDTSQQFKDGDLVAFECARRKWSQHEKCPEGSIHARTLHFSTGKKYKYRLGGNYFVEGAVKIIGVVVGVKRASPQDEKHAHALDASEARARLLPVTENLLRFNIFKGDSVCVTLNNTAPVGSLIVIKEPSGDFWAARVCSNDKRGIFIVDNYDERGMLKEYKYTAFGPVTEIRRANAEKIAALRARLEKLKTDDEWFDANEPRLRELEHELYNLENPPEEKSQNNEWPDVIGGEL